MTMSTPNRPTAINDIAAVKPSDQHPLLLKVKVFADRELSAQLGTIDMGNKNHWKYFKGLLIVRGDGNDAYEEDPVLSCDYPNTVWIDPYTINTRMNDLDPDSPCLDSCRPAFGPCPPWCKQKILFNGLDRAFDNCPVNVSFLQWLDDNNLSKNLDSSTRFYTESIWYYKEQNNGAEVEVDKYSQVVPSYPEAGSRGALAGIEGIDDLDENAPVEDIISKFNALLDTLKKSAMSLVLGAAMLPLLVFGNSLEPDDPEGIQFKKIPGSTLMYTRDQIDFQQEKRYAMFIIPLNEQLEDKFTTFELKASTNNFSAVKEFDRIVFWSVSTTADIASLTNSVDNAEYIQDGMRLYIENTPLYYDKFATNVLKEGQYDPSRPYIDIRRYQRISNSLAVDGRVTATGEPYYINSYVVIVDSELCRTHVPPIWLRNNNDELIWTYVRAYANGSKETDPEGRMLWHPIAPVKWFKDLPKWANHDAIDIFDRGN